MFPVVVDPSVTLSDTGDSYIEGGSLASTNFDGVTPMCIGYDGTYTAYQRVLMSYDVTGNLPPEAQVLNADLGLYVTSNTGSVSITALGLSRVFTPSGVTWNTYDGTNSWTSAGGDTISGGPTVTTTVTTTSGYAHLYPTALVAAWLHGDHPQDGLLIKATSETSSAGKLCVTDNTAPAGQTPYLTVYWQMPTGDRPIATYRSYPVDDKETLKVDVVSGNAVLEAADDSVTGVGQNFQLTRAYNSGAGPYNLTGYLGQGWGLSPSSNTSLGVWGDGSITYYGPTGTAWTFIPTGDGSHFTAPSGIDADLVYTSGSNSYTLTGHGGGLVQTFSPHELTSVKDRNGNTITVNDPTSDEDLDGWTDTEGRAYTTSYWSAGAGYGYLETATDAAGHTVTYDYSTAPDGHTLLTSVVDANGKTTSYGYDSNDQLNLITSPAGRQIEITYTYGVVSSVCRPDPHTSTTPCDTFATNYTTHEATVTDANSHATTYTFETDELKVTKVTDPLGHAHQGTWSGDDHPSMFTDAMSPGNAVTLAYDNLNNLKSIQLPAEGSTSGATTNLGYPTASGNAPFPSSDYWPNAATDPQSNCTAYSYDSAGNQTDVYTGQASGCAGKTGGTHLSDAYQGDSGVPSCGGKAGELCTTTDGRGNTTTYGYDSNGNLSSITPPAPRPASSVAIDANTNLVSSVTDGKGQKTSYFYDPLGRIIELGFGGYTASPCSSSAAAAGNCIGYTYDTDGNLTSRLDNTGTTSWTLDGLGRVYQKTFPDATTSTVTYDKAGNITSYTDAGGTVSYHYDPSNNLWDLTEPGGSCAAYPTAPSFPNTTVCTGFADNANNQRTAVNYPSGESIAIGYDSSGRETSVTAKRPLGTTFLSRTYSYTTSASTDSALIQSVTDQAGTKTSYGYSALDQLTSAVTGTTTLGYTYDAVGNLTQATHTGVSTVYYGYNNADQLCWSGTSSGTIPSPGSNCTSNPGPSGNTDYLYDGDGNTCWSATSTGTSYSCASPPSGATVSTYNAKNQTTAVGSHTFTYADTGQSERTASGGVTYLNGLLGLTGRSDPIYFTRDNKGNLIGLRQGAGSGSTNNYYTPDILGSVIGVTSSSGLTDTALYTYDPYGNVTSQSGSLDTTNPWEYASSYYQTVTGLAKMGDRYYNQAVGRFTQQDSVAGSISNPASVDPYVYANDNPINLTDPTGQNAFSAAEAIFEGVSQSVFGFGLAGAAITGGDLGAGVSFAGVSGLGVGFAAFTGIGLGVIGVGLLAVGFCEIFC